MHVAKDRQTIRGLPLRAPAYQAPLIITDLASLNVALNGLDKLRDKQSAWQQIKAALPKISGGSEYVQRWCSRQDRLRPGSTRRTRPGRACCRRGRRRMPRAPWIS